MLINLLPDFLAILDSTDRLAAYQRFFAAHRKILEPYWNNYVIDPDSPHFVDIVRAAVSADRTDLVTMLERTDVVALARNAEQQCRELLALDCDVDVVLMVGVGAANAGELVVDGRGIAFVCLEHFTGIQNPQTDGLGLDPELIPLWLPKLRMSRGIRRRPAAASFATSSRNPRVTTPTGTRGVGRH